MQMKLFKGDDFVIVTPGTIAEKDWRDRGYIPIADNPQASSFDDASEDDSDSVSYEPNASSHSVSSPSASAALRAPAKSTRRQTR